MSILRRTQVSIAVGYLQFLTKVTSSNGLHSLEPGTFMIALGRIPLRVPKSSRTISWAYINPFTIQWVSRNVSRFQLLFTNIFLDDCGDHVVLINTGEIALPGDEWIKRVYFHHTGFPGWFLSLSFLRILIKLQFKGGASWTLAWQLHEKDATMVMKKAVYNAMKGNLQRRHTMQRLHLFPDDKIPEEILANVTNQIKQTRVVPKRLDHIDKETLENFPAIMDYPKDYVLR